MYNNNSKIKTIEDVERLAKYLYNERHVAFHPDDDFADYVNDETGESTFTEVEIPLFNHLMDECFEVCEREMKDIYEVMSAFHPLLQQFVEE